MIGYRRLTLEKRYQIQALKDTEISLREMAKVLGVAPSTLSREFKRNSFDYCPKKAQKNAIKKRQGIGPKRKITGRLKTAVDRRLKKQLSPDQIAGNLKEKNIFVSHEAIYQYVYREHVESIERELYLNLRRKRKWRRSRQTRKNQSRCGFRQDRVNIKERPAIVEKRNRVGDFERDLMLGKRGRLITIVDRTSKLVKIGKVTASSAQETHEQTIKLLRGLKVHTITNDNGHEFSWHKQTGKRLNAKVYFADPHCSWQRGTNENTNGLIRQYFPKGTDFTKISIKELKRIEHLLNNRPRKRLGYRTPKEVHRQLSQTVALST